MCKCVFFVFFFYFYSENMPFKNNKSLEHLNVLLSIFYTYFYTFWCFLDFTKGGKSEILKKFLSRNFFLSQFNFWLIIWKEQTFVLSDKSNFFSLLHPYSKDSKKIQNFILKVFLERKNIIHNLYHKNVIIFFL